MSLRAFTAPDLVFCLKVNTQSTRMAKELCGEIIEERL